MCLINTSSIEIAEPFSVLRIRKVVPRVVEHFEVPLRKDGLSGQLVGKSESHQGLRVNPPVFLFFVFCFLFFVFKKGMVVVHQKSRQLSPFATFQTFCVAQARKQESKEVVWYVWMD